MIPQVSIDIDAELPDAARFCIPDEEEISEEGFGWFRDTWRITDVELSEAREVLNEDERLLALVDRIATSAEAFEEIAFAVEGHDVDMLPGDLVPSEELDELRDLIDTDMPILENLELGVAGLVFALAAAGCFPAASCRSHAHGRSWAERPVVMLAADGPHARAIQPLVLRSGCGFDLDYSRPDLITIHAQSLREMIVLAGLLLESVERGELPLMSHADQLARNSGGEDLEYSRAEIPGQLPLFE